jgi:hypothetical protein
LVTAVEVAPGFRFTDGTARVCDTNNGGRYIVSTAEAEQLSIEQSDLSCNGNTRALARMLKQWRVEKNVPLKSFQLERLAVDFLAQYESCARDIFFYDWMVRAARPISIPTRTSSRAPIGTGLGASPSAGFR